MRVPQSSNWQQANTALQQAGRAAATARQQLSTGRRINTASDDPGGAVIVSALRADIGADEAYTRATADARTWLTVSENALQTSVDVLARARELVINGANDSHSSTSREAIAIEIEQIRDQLVGLANTEFLGKSVFGGFAGSAVSFDGVSASYVGDSGAVQRRIDSREIIAVNTDGAEAFGFNAGDDVFAVLTSAAAEVRAADTATLGTSTLNRLVSRHDGLLAGIAEIGARTNAVDRQESLLADRFLQLSDHAASIESVDFAEAAMEVARAGAAYEAALAATAQLNAVSLLDFL
jgi:flagellar hook-associated protein 3 FlgL